MLHLLDLRLRMVEEMDDILDIYASEEYVPTVREKIKTFFKSDNNLFCYKGHIRIKSKVNQGICILKDSEGGFIYLESTTHPSDIYAAMTDVNFKDIAKPYLSTLREAFI